MQRSTGCCAARRRRLTIPDADSSEPKTAKRSLSIAFSAQARSRSTSRRRATRCASRRRSIALASRPMERICSLTGRFLADTIYELTRCAGRHPRRAQAPARRPGLHAAFRLRGRAPEPRLRRAAGHRRALRPAARADARRAATTRSICAFTRSIRCRAISGRFPRTASRPMTTTEPPLPGNEPAQMERRQGRATPDAIAARINALGSPAVSELAALPIQRGGAGAKFGLDLKPLLRAHRGAGPARRLSRRHASGRRRQAQLDARAGDRSRR